MKKVLVGAMALLTLAACSNEEVLQKNEVKQEINFTAVTGKALTRAADGYCNNSLPGAIKVWASFTTDESSYKPYFSEETFNRPTTGTVYTSALSHYWPDGKLSFYACVNAPEDATNKPGWNSLSTNLEIAQFVVAQDAHSQKDFIYALTPNAEKSSLTPDTKLNFRHGLSQVVFNAQNENQNIYVEIYGVTVRNVKDSGKFTFPTSTTESNYVDHTNATTTDKTGWGTWDLNESVSDFYTNNNVAWTTPIKVIGNDTKVNVTTSAAEYNDETMYLMPQTFGTDTKDTKLWSSSEAGKPSASTKAYLVLLCKIWNVAKPDLLAADGMGGKKDSDVFLYGSTTEPAKIAVALPDVDWEQGKKYIYTFKFTAKGNGGYEDDKDGPTPVFTPIKLDVTVDDFAKGEDKEVPMK